MRQKKSSKIIIIIIIILVILISLAGITYTYFATDTFKGNKELFFKYMLQMGEEQEGFIETELKQYFEKQKTPYLDEGSIDANVTASSSQKQSEKPNSMNVTFDGQVDTANSQVIQNISLNYADNVKFPFVYKQIGDTIGFQTNHIGNKFIVFNKENLQNLETDLVSGDKSTNRTNGLQKMQEFADISLTKEDLQRVKDTYFKVLNEQLQDSNFSKIEEANSKGYQLTLEGEKLKSLLVKLLEALKNDQATLDKINEYVKVQKNSLKVTASVIDNKIKDINNNVELNREKLEIIVYQAKGRTIRLLAKINQMELKLEKAITGNDQQYNLELQITDNNQTGKIAFITKFAGLQSMQSITENHELTLETEKIKYQYNYHNNIEFTESTTIEKFDNNNSLMLSQTEEEQKNEFLKAVVERLQSVNKSQMEELGWQENENPLQYVIPQFSTYFSALNTINANNDNMSEQEVSTFNALFENYQSTNLKGVTVKGLLSTIQRNNEAREDGNRKIKEIHFDGEEYEVTEQSITLLKSNVETEEAYRVEFEKDEDTGIIYRAVINKK